MTYLESSPEEKLRDTRWPGRIGLILESPELMSDLSQAMIEIKADCVFRSAAGVPIFEVASLVERESVDLLFVEMAKVNGGGAEWIRGVRAGGDLPLIVAVHPTPDPPAMIEAMRAGAIEFLSVPMRPGIFDAIERMTILMEGRRAAAQVRGRMAGILSAKGGCGATTVGCHLAAALRHEALTGREATLPGKDVGMRKVLVADLDSQAPAAHRIFRVHPRKRVSDAFESARRLNAACWTEFVTDAGPGVDLLAGWDTSTGAGLPSPEPWRTESMFRSLSRSYSWVLADLGRNLNPSIWGFIQNLDDLLIVTAPDVLALYQTRSILQTLAGRGFEKTRVHLILNRNQKGPQDLWVESIRTMFEMNVLAVIPDDPATLDHLPRDRFEFPASSLFGRGIQKLAGRLTMPAKADAGKKAS
jgi:pilus assembly protein CpaE